MFDRNPKATPADRFIAGKTTDAVVGAIASAIRTGSAGVTADVMVADAILALDARFTRKAERRAAVA
jgi:uncharacterized protein YaiI (UPF0178 family)